MTWFSSDIQLPFPNLNDLNSHVTKEPITVVIKYLVPYIVNRIVTYKFPASTIPYEHLVLYCNINAGKKELRNLLNKFTGKIDLRGHTFITSMKNVQFLHAPPCFFCLSKWVQIGQDPPAPAH